MNDESRKGKLTSRPLIGASVNERADNRLLGRLAYEANDCTRWHLRLLASRPLGFANDSL